MCRCRPNVRTPCCGSDACHAVLAKGELCPWCARAPAPAKAPSVDDRMSAIESRLDRVESLLRLSPASPDCTLCKGTGVVRWGVPERIDGREGPCICQQPPWKTR